MCIRDSIKLEQNYRSTGNILDAANAVISNNVGRKDKQLWTDNGEGEKIKFCQFDTGYDEAEYIADDIEREVRNGASYNDHAILYRTNAQSRLFCLLYTSHAIALYKSILSSPCFRKPITLHPI